MGSGATRFLLLLTPSPLLHRRCSSLLRLSRRHYHRLPSSLHHHQHQQHHSLSSTPPLPTTTTCFFPLKSSRELHTQLSSLPHAFSPSIHQHFPQFQALLGNLSASGYYNLLNDADFEFLGARDLPEDFLRAAKACLSFARDRPNLLGMVSRRDVEVVVENTTPFLFKNGEDSVRRIKSFLGNNELDTDKANTVDLMKFLLSCASNLIAFSEANSFNNWELVELSVSNLLGELAKLSCRTPESNLSGSLQNQFPDRYGQTPRPFGQNIEMKRGDWICPRCSFMNFARNQKCLECEEARPKKQLTGGEWECPQCEFFNYARNTVCLRCDCKRPGELSPGMANNRSGQGYGYGSLANQVDIDSRLAANEEKAQRWFSKVSQLDNTSDMSSAIADEDFPEIMPLRKGVNRFVVSTRKTPLERRLTNAQYRRNMGNDGIPEGNDLQMGDKKKSLDPNFNQSVDDNFPASSSGSSQYGNYRGSNSNYVPFVPLPADMFAKKPESFQVDESMRTQSGNYQSDASNTHEQTDGFSGGNDYLNPEKKIQLSGKPVNQKEMKNKENEQAEKSERWFKRVAELDDVTDLASEISDEEFPEIMPMRKGENRFVVNKKKDRSLTSPMYKRHMATEQANNTNFVPFVPFPPDYFAKKDKQQPEGADMTPKAAEETTNSVLPGKMHEARPPVPDMDGMRQMENQQTSSMSFNSKPAGENFKGHKTSAAYGTSTNETSTQKFNSPPPMSNDNLSQPTDNQSSKMVNLAGSASQPTADQNIRNSWSGKSLEGSAVKEPDPLDMSEEAKAERWFRRVAQIKDISELSQIPDEDFPSIMPMRKGVNRFVVSKRKTPLERRLTSQQYRRNLPIVSSDPTKKENDNN
ncbi:hypothetical protein Patl1_23546 [Pistacia atlantica]|uniref:Uncharacterized protein n=1 Tax=Pistacia atlantica TaxID=434234 RepID=A0ACC1A2B5_9ROSI|nr:hypothetical protein Patl1_23546 [Pistacia atlantica]